MAVPQGPAPECQEQNKETVTNPPPAGAGRPPRPGAVSAARPAAQEAGCHLHPRPIAALRRAPGECVSQARGLFLA